MNEAITISLIILGVFTILFLVLREMVTWYWKINQAIDLLTQIEENTRKHSIDNKAKSKIMGTNESKMETLEVSTAKIPGV